MSLQMQRKDWQTYSLDGISRTDWSGTQAQQITDKQLPPHKYKFPYGLTKIKVQRGHKMFTEDKSGGKWYFEDELIFATKTKRYNYNVFQNGYYHGLILMTKYEAREMGLSESEVIKNYRQDEQWDRESKRFGNNATFFFNYRKDGSIESIYTPPPPPPPVIKYIEVPVPALPPKVEEVIPEPVFISEPEPVIAENQRVAEVSQTLDMKWILLALVGVGLLVAIIFTLRGRN